MTDEIHDPMPPYEVPVARPGVPVARPVAWEASAPPPDPMLLESISRAGALIDVLLLLVVAGVALVLEGGVIFLAAWAKGLPMPTMGDMPDPELLRVALVPAMAMRTLVLTVGVVGISKLRGLTLASLGIGLDRFVLNTVIGVLLTLAIYAVLFAGLMVLSLAAPDLVKGLQQNTQNLKEMVPRMSLVTFLLLTALVAWWEEVIFRGFLMTRLRRVTGSWMLAVVLSAAVFTALHLLEQAVAAMLVISVLALAFSGITIWRRSLIPAMVAHLLFNFSQFFMLYYFVFPESVDV